MNAKALKPAFAAPVLTGLALGLSACADEADAPVEPPREGSVPGITISDARLVLNAVEGNPAAVYFNLSYDGDKGLAIRDARVEGAGDADVHAVMEYDGRMQMNTANPVPLTTGTEVAFEPGGLHIMAFDPSGDLTPGTTTTVTLVLAGGATHEFEAEVRAIGDDETGPTGDES